MLPSEIAVKKVLYFEVLLAHFANFEVNGHNTKQKRPFEKKVKSFLAFCIPMRMKMKRVGRATSVRSPNGTAASNLTQLNVKGFSAKTKSLQSK
jgi:hypothetical protein